MFCCEGEYIALCDFGMRFSQNFACAVNNLKSNIYFVNDERIINAKSILGIISANIHNGDIFHIRTFHGNSLEQAEKDFKAVHDIMVGEKYAVKDQ